MYIYQRYMVEAFSLSYPPNTSHTYTSNEYFFRNEKADLKIVMDRESFDINNKINPILNYKYYIKIIMIMHY